MSQQTENERLAKLEANMERIKASVGRIVDLIGTPEFKENAAKIATENIELDKRQAEGARRIRLEQSGILPKFRGLLDKPEMTDAILLMQDFLASAPVRPEKPGDPQPRTMLVLAGPAGRGKSAACSIGVWRAGGYYYDAQELLRESTFDPGLWYRLQAAPFLALDELGAEATNTAWEANLYDLLNGRDARLRKTVIATNLNAAAFRERYTAAGLKRLLDRINTGGSFKVLPGESMRKPWNAKPWQDNDKDDQ